MRAQVAWADAPDRIWQLQVFDFDAGEYVVNSSDTDREALASWARGEGFRAWRIVDVNREKPLPMSMRGVKTGTGNFPRNPRPRWQWKQRPVEVDHG